MRTADGTFINLNVSGLPNNTEDYYVYTVDQAGTVSLLEEITVENGMNKACLQTPMSKFMLLISPKANLKTYNGDSAVIFRSRVPEGYALLVPNNY